MVRLTLTALACLCFASFADAGPFMSRRGGCSSGSCGASAWAAPVQTQVSGGAGLTTVRSASASASSGTTAAAASASRSVSAGSGGCGGSARRGLLGRRHGGQSVKIVVRN